VRKPNAFIVGAPKCGTTAMCHYLGQHPGAFLSDPKEPHYFAHEDMPNSDQYFTDLDSYLSLFAAADKSQKILVEGSVWYLYCENAIKRIAEFNPSAKIIVMLRRPDEMVYSFHSQALLNFYDDVECFSTAWKMAKHPELRKRLPRSCKEPMIIKYDKIATYGRQLERVYQSFSKSQVHIIFYEDFSQKTAEVYSETLSFLGLDDAHEISFERINENSVVRNRFFGRFIEHPPATLLRLWSVLKDIVGLKKIGLRDKLLTLNSTKAVRPVMEESVRRDIVENYKSDTLLLQKITGRDLTSWLR